VQRCDGVVGEEGAISAGSTETVAHIFGSVFEAGGGNEKAVMDAGAWS
jgi:hypothetical protein